MRRLILTLLFVSIVALPTFARASNSGFDYPVGRPNGAGYYDAQGFGGTNNILPGYHLGEDWNGYGCGDCDYGSPVYALSDGTVDQATYLHVWGNVVTVVHQISDKRYKSLYAHMKDVYVRPGQTLSRGQQIGTMGKGDKNQFVAHLHLEVRDNAALGIGTGYSSTYRPSGWVDPTDFINSHRPPPAAVLTASAPENNGTTLTWSNPIGNQFDRAELYRSETAGGTENPTVHTLIFSSTDPSKLSYSDSNLPIGLHYYRALVYLKNGLVSESAEVPIEVKREIKNIATGKYYQSNPVIAGGKVYYADQTPNGNYPNHKLFDYDLTSAKNESFDLSGSINYAFTPQSADQKVTFYSTDWNGCSRVYYFDIKTQTTIPVSIGDFCPTQYSPDISETGVVVWQQLGSDNRFKIYLNDTRYSAGPVRVSTGSGSELEPRISDDRIIWKDNRNYDGASRYDIYMKDLSTGLESKIAEDTGDDQADIDGDWVVWQNETKINLLNVVTHEQKLVAATGGGYSPSINEGKVAYTLFENQSTYVHVYDVASGSDLKIDQPLQAVSFPAYGNGYVAWDDVVGTIPGNKDIFLTKL